MAKHKRSSRSISRYRWPLMIIATIMLTASLLTLRLHSSLTHFSTRDAGADEDVAGMWKTFPGVTITAQNGVHFAAIDRKIVNQDGSGGQADSAVNVGGSHLTQNGDFDLTLTMSNLDGGDASFRLYRDIPIIYDEWRYDGTGVGLTLNGQKMTVDIWDGQHDGPASSKSYALDSALATSATDSTDSVANKNPPRWQFWRRHRKSRAVVKTTVPDAPVVTTAAASSAARTVTLQRLGSQFNILVDGKRVATLSAKSLFTKGNLWFGGSATGDGWTLDGMNLSGNASLQNATVSTAASLATSSTSELGALATAVRPSLKMGTAVSLYPLMTDPSYRTLALRQFAMWTPENAMKAQFIHPAKGVYSFEHADLLVDTAVKNGITVHGHALVFAEANPTWMQTTPGSQLKSAMEEHITTIMQHYASKVAEWDVINEPLADYDTPEGTSGLRKSIWYNAMGESFITSALTTARKADPAAKLYINEFGLEADDDRWNTFIKLLEKLQAANVPLDGVGFQAHVYDDADTIDPNVLRKHMQQLAKMGLASRISEIDVHGEDAAYQAKQYQAVLGACKAEPSCTSFSTWGISDKYGSTTSDHTYPPEYGNDLLWDSNFQPKAAIGALLSALK